MTKRMLIDATHAEETRVAIVDNNILADFDYESTVRKQMKGSIYLAKVTRVEPSLQAAFVNFGGNRHGFLPFSEIHPDYFRIPVADRDAFIAAQKEELDKHDELSRHTDDVEDEDEKAEDDAEDDEDEDDEEDVVEVGGDDKPAKDGVAEDVVDDDDEINGNVKPDDEDDGPNGNVVEDEPDEDDNVGNSRNNNRKRGNRGGRGRNGRHNNNRGGRGRRSNARSRRVEMVGGEGVDSDVPFRFNLRRNYKIQEVVKRGQIMLVQVSKEERGNKGAAVTTYLSLPGRYCVLMPNSPRAGGVSRKISNYKDRKRMKEVLDGLEIPDGKSVILRTAGVQRTKAEIKRDFDYLLRLWDNIVELTKKSYAPEVVYEEGNLIKRSIRDLYAKEIEEIQVSGEEGYKAARDFMKMLIPSHVKRVKEFKSDKQPLFHHYKVEKQISDIGEPTVTLKSGGYLVINPTEALVSVDVNSGKATKERHIEETALKTNLDAAEEVARQLRLRDLGGLVVIDFIDMEDRRNNRKVENRLRDALSNDRARIQIGRISSFGLLELSRQRLNPSLTEAMFKQCPHCLGVGYIRTDDAAAIRALRALEEEGIKGTAAQLSLTVPNDVAVYILNNKRSMLADIEARYGFKVHISSDDEMHAGDFGIAVLKKKSDDKEDTDGVDEDVDVAVQEDDSKDNKKPGRSGRRRGRRGGRGRRNQNRDDDQDAGGKDDDQKKASKKDDDKAPAKKDDVKESKPAAAKKDEKKDDKPKAKKPAAKKDEKKDEKKAADKDEKPKKPAPSNDTKPAKKEAKKDDKPKDYEVVNEAPKEKKKGWWNKGS